MRLVALLASLAGSNEPAAPGRTFFLDLRGARLVSANPDGTDVKVVGSELKQGPDGVAVDLASRHIFWSKTILTGQGALTGIAHAEIPK